MSGMPSWGLDTEWGLQRLAGGPQTEEKRERGEKRERASCRGTHRGGELKVAENVVALSPLCEGG